MKKSIKKKGGEKRNFEMSKSRTSNVTSKKQRVTDTQPTLNKTRHTLHPSPVFRPTQSEGVVEANLSFLIALMGSSIYDTYVENILNAQIATTNANNAENNLASKEIQEIRVIQINAPMNPGEEYLKQGFPAIFYGKRNATHFTCYTGAEYKKVVDSYKNGIQKDGTDHFCQTFALMHMEHHFFPESKIGEYYQKLNMNKTEEGYLHNAMVAIEAACYVIETTNDYCKAKRAKNVCDIRRFVEDQLYETERNGEPSHQMVKKIPIKNIIPELLNYCRSITKEQILNDTFIQKIWLT